jgi:hypothetical protein
MLREDYSSHIYICSKALFADDGLLVGAGDVVELDAVLVEVVEDAQAPLVTLPVVWLGPAKTGKTIIAIGEYDNLWFL